MDRAPADGEERRPVESPAVSASAAYDGETRSIAAARAFARDFLIRVQSVHGLPVSSRVLGTTQLVVSELITNACKYAPGPCLLDLEVADDMLLVTVWDTDPTLPAARPADPGRIGQHGLEIVMAVCQGFDLEREPVGKRISVRISLVDDPRNDPAGRRPQ